MMATYKEAVNASPVSMATRVYAAGRRDYADRGAWIAWQFSTPDGATCFG